MSKRKAVIILLLIAITFFHGKNLVNAEEIFFTNKNGVSMTEKEYNFFREMYNDNYPKIIPQDVYDIFKNGNYFDGNIRVNTYTEDTNPNTRGTFHSTANKSIRIAASCTTTCAIAVSANWINNPTIRSYDVIGAYLYNVSTIGSISTQAASNTKNVFATSTKRQTNGHGASILLPSGSNIGIFQTFTTNKGGKIYASYQHAMNNTTLAVRQQFNVSTLGYVNVFKFYADAANIYDNMNGVDIDV